MAARKSKHVPKLRHHKATGQALVELSGRRIYLGRFGTPEAEAKYHRTVSEWIAIRCLWRQQAQRREVH